MTIDPTYMVFKLFFVFLLPQAQIAYPNTLYGHVSYLQRYIWCAVR